MVYAQEDENCEHCRWAPAPPKGKGEQTEPNHPDSNDQLRDLCVTRTW